MSDLQDIFDLAYFYLKFRLRSKKEMQDYLYKKSKTRYFSREMVDRVVLELEKKGLIDDREFVTLFIESRNKNRPKSEYILRRELARFGIDKTIIDAYFATNLVNEETLAEVALEKKWRRFAALAEPLRFQKATSFLSRRGFSFDIIKKTVANMTKKE